MPTGFHQEHSAVRGKPVVGGWLFPAASDAGLGLGQVGQSAPGPVPRAPSLPFISLSHMGHLWAFSDDGGIWQSKEN